MLRQRLGELVFRLTTARVIDLSEQAPKEVRFGATVRVRSVVGVGDDEAWEATVVGADEADAATQRISFYSPVAQALVGKRAGDRAVMETEEGEMVLEVVAVQYRGDGEG